MADRTQTADIPATQKNSAALSDWGDKLRFDRSFYAKLILSEWQIKEYYAQIATSFLRYEKVRARMNWSGVTFTAGRIRVGTLAFRGKTLCVYLALDPAVFSEGKYRAQDVCGVASRAKTPAMFRVRSEGAKRFVLSRVEDTAAAAGLSLRDVAPQAVQAKDFESDSFQNLIARGLIRVLRTTARDDTRAESVPHAGADSVYRDTCESVGALLARHGIFGKISAALSEGEGSARFTERHMLRAVDEIWVRTVEDCLGALDTLIRNPQHYIAETEEVLPIELTKKITGRSVTHLARHTDYISLDRDGDIIPTKMLNVFRDDSLLTYENKFLNTLLNRLCQFVERRYSVAKEYGVDERVEQIQFENTFALGEGKATVRLQVSYSEQCTDTDVRRVLPGTGLWQRVERLHDIVSAYMQSPFVRAMERNFIRPPVMRTNAILKNKYLRSCLALWEFIESYEDAGYGITVDEKTKEISPEYVRSLYENAILQYFLFRHAVDEKYGSDEQQEFTLKPKYSVNGHRDSDVSAEEFSEEYDTQDADADTLATALSVALAADEVLDRSGADSFTRTFHAKLRLAPDEVKEKFALLSNALLSYKRVRARHSMRYASFTCGRSTLARVSVGGKSLKLYLAIPCKEVPPKYGATDVSHIVKFAQTPSMVRVRSPRSVRYAMELICMLAQRLSLSPAGCPTTPVRAEDFAAEPILQMVQRGWMVPVRRTAGGAPRPLPAGERKNPQVLILAQQASILASDEAGIFAQQVHDATAWEPSSDRQVSPPAANPMPEFIHPDSDYERPDRYGIDDASGFIRDSEQSTQQAHSEPDPAVSGSWRHRLHKEDTP